MSPTPQSYVFAANPPGPPRSHQEHPVTRRTLATSSSRCPCAGPVCARGPGRAEGGLPGPGPPRLWGARPSQGLAALRVKEALSVLSLEFPPPFSGAGPPPVKKRLACSRLQVNPCAPGLLCAVGPGSSRPQDGWGAQMPDRLTRAELPHPREHPIRAVDCAQTCGVAPRAPEAPLGRHVRGDHPGPCPATSRPSDPRPGSGRAHRPAPRARVILRPPGPRGTPSARIAPSRAASYGR